MLTPGSTESIQPVIVGDVPTVGIYVLKLVDFKYNPLTVINKVLLL